MTPEQKEINEKPYLVIHAAILIGCVKSNAGYAAPYIVGNFDRRHNTLSAKDVIETSPDREFHMYLYGQMQRHAQRIATAGNILWNLTRFQKSQADKEESIQKVISQFTQLGVAPALGRQLAERSLKNIDFHLVGDLEYYEPTPEIKQLRDYDVRPTNFRLLTPKEDKRKSYMLSNSV